MLKFLKAKFNKLDIHTREVASKSFYSTIVKVSAMLASFVLSIMLGRTIGAEGIGIINLANRIVVLVMVFCLLGVPNVVIKKTAIAVSENNWKYIGNTIHTVLRMNGGLSLVITVIFILISPYLANNVFHEPRLTYPLVVAFVVLTPQVFSRIFASGFIGFRKVWQSNLVDQALSVWVTLLLLSFIWLMNYKISILLVAILFAIGRLAVTTTTWVYWKKLFPYKFENKMITREILKTSLPLLLVSATAVISASSATILLGWLGNSTDVGLFSVAARLALLTIFFLQVTNSAVSPKLASLFAAGKIDEMQKMVQKVTLGLMIIGFIFLILFIVFGKYILSIWGEEFISSYWILVILATGQFVNIGTGAGGLLLMMCGFEKLQSRISLFFVLLNVILGIVLIYFLGVIGAAISMAITIAGENITRVIYAKKKTNVLTIPINIFYWK